MNVYYYQFPELIFLASTTLFQMRVTRGLFAFYTLKQNTHKPMYRYLLNSLNYFQNGRD